MADDGHDLTIEDLARATGLTVRNLRSHRTAGLLPPPDVRASVGYYGPEHVARVRLVQELQAEGFNLTAIKRLLDETHSSATTLLGLRRVASAPDEADRSIVLDAEDLAAAFGDQASPELLRTAIELGEIVPLEDGRVEMTNAALFDAARVLAERGVSLDAVLPAFTDVRQVCDDLATRFIGIFDEQVWRPFAEAGYPEERWEEVVETMTVLRGVASEAVLAIFRPAMAKAVEQRIGSELTRLTRDAAPPSR